MDNKEFAVRLERLACAAAQMDGVEILGVHGTMDDPISSLHCYNELLAFASERGLDLHVSARECRSYPWEVSTRVGQVKCFAILSEKEYDDWRESRETV